MQYICVYKTLFTVLTESRNITTVCKYMVHAYFLHLLNVQL